MLLISNLNYDLDIIFNCKSNLSVWILGINSIKHRGQFSVYIYYFFLLHFHHFLISMIIIIIILGPCLASKMCVENRCIQHSSLSISLFTWQIIFKIISYKFHFYFDITWFTVVGCRESCVINLQDGTISSLPNNITL